MFTNFGVLPVHKADDADSKRAFGQAIKGAPSQTVLADHLLFSSIFIVCQRWVFFSVAFVDSKVLGLALDGFLLLAARHDSYERRCQFKSTEPELGKKGFGIFATEVARVGAYLIKQGTEVASRYRTLLHMDGG